MKDLWVHCSSDLLLIFRQLNIHVVQRNIVIIRVHIVCPVATGSGKINAIHAPVVLGVVLLNPARPIRLDEWFECFVRIQFVPPLR